MAVFRHYPDDVITFPSGFRCTLVELQAQVAGYQLPAGAAYAELDPIARTVTYWTADGSQRGANLTAWPSAVAVLGSSQSIIAAIQAYRAANTPPPRTLAARSDLRSAINALDPATRQALITEALVDWLREHPKAAKTIGVDLDGDAPANVVTP